MPLPRVVFHGTDYDLFESFIRSLGRQILIDPLRKDKTLRARYFRGYRISQTHPDVAAISKAYYKEINTHRNGQLMDYLCDNWVLVHPELATSALEHLGMSNIDLHARAKWLTDAHNALQTRGHLDAEGEITRALAFDYPLADILTVFSILSIDFDSQEELRRHIEEEFNAVHDDPARLREALMAQQSRLQSEFEAIEQRRADEDKGCEAELSDLNGELTALGRKQEALENKRESHERAVHKSDLELKRAQAEHDAAHSALQKWKSKYTKLEGSVATLQHKLAQRSSVRDRVLAELDEQKNAIERKRSDIADRLRATEERLTSSTDASNPRRSSQDTRPTGSEGAVELLAVLDFVNRPGFTASPVTLDIFWRHLQGQISKVDSPSGSTQLVAEKHVGSVELAQIALYGDPAWSGDVLGRYALRRSLETAQEAGHDIDIRTDILIGGLYHAERILESELVEELLTGLIRLVVGIHDGNDEEWDPKNNTDVLREHLADPSKSRRFASIQAKLATANPRALRRLYDVMPLASRLAAKRALVKQVRTLGLQDTDPTHEILDVVTTHLEGLVNNLSGRDYGWGEWATLRGDVQRTRRSVLQNAAKLAHVFSAVSNRRLTRFRDLLGPQLTEVLANDTVDGYNVFGRLLLEYCLGDCRRPEWVSGRFLFPIVVSLAQVTLRADHAVRQRKADIGITLEKTEHPLSTVRSDVPLNLAIENAGGATATEVNIEVETDKKEIAIRPRTYTFPKIGPKQRVWHNITMDIRTPVSAVELACLLHWNDPSGVSRLIDATLKLTAQREVNWASAQVTPYSLGSIKSQERLVGRDDDLEALRSGIKGTQSFFITGQKRVGKTSVARVLLKEFEQSNEHVAVYVTFGELGMESWQALVYSLYEAINHELHDITGGRGATLLPRDQFGTNQPRHNRAFLRDLKRALDGRRVICIIDDFDELDEDMYKGSGAKELFLRLRTLIDGGYVSFVFVGSERLPDMLKYQGERLNQVQQHSLNYFRDRSSLQQLAAVPAQPYLEYSEEAIDKIWWYSAGNPYYATQICAKVYGDMVARRDYYVGGSDVERSVLTICRESSVSTFQHFWTDGIFEGGLDIVRLQYLNALILMVCARHCEGRPESEAELEKIVSDRSVGGYDPAQVRFRLANLVDRGVLSQVGGRVRLRVPLFERWLLVGGEGAVRSSFSQEDLQTRLTPIVGGPAARRVVEVVKDLTYQGLPLSEDRVRAWLEQFGPAENQNLALQLLEGMKKKGYYGEAAVRASCKSLHRVMLDELTSEERFAKVVRRGRVTNVFVGHFQGDGRSGARVLNDYRNANSWPTTRTGSMQDAVQFVAEQRGKKRGCGVIFVDDFIGTGASCSEGLEAFRGEMIRVGGGEGLLDGVVVGVAAIIGFRAGMEAVRANDHVDCHVVTSEELGPEDMAFAQGAGVFGTEKERAAAERLCTNIGTELEPKQPLGYGGCQALVCFHYRCPNNTVPVFYKDGVVYQGREWIPLFPR